MLCQAFQPSLVLVENVDQPNKPKTAFRKKKEKKNSINLKWLIPTDHEPKDNYVFREVCVLVTFVPFLPPPPPRPFLSHFFKV